jgi:hypothetical protein
MMDQLDRIHRQTKGEIPAPVCLLLRFSSSANPAEVLEKTRNVMEILARALRGTWPSDEEWRRDLPSWFVRSFEGHSLKDLLAYPTLWDFGSWLDAMKNPGWEWWSSLAEERGGMVRCTAHSDPFAVEPLVYLLRTAGAAEVEVCQE